MTNNQAERTQMVENAEVQTTAITRATRGRLALRERQKRALELRLSGLTYDEIARTVGYRAKSAAWKAVETALAEIVREPAQAVRDLELRRLDEMLLTLWPRMKGGDMQAMAGCLKIAERRARLLGLDAAESVDVTSGGEAVDAITVVHVGVDLSRV